MLQSKASSSEGFSTQKMFPSTAKKSPADIAPRDLSNEELEYIIRTGKLPPKYSGKDAKSEQKPDLPAAPSQSSATASNFSASIAPSTAKSAASLRDRPPFNERRHSEFS